MPGIKTDRIRENPEALVQKRIIKMLKARDWYVTVMHASFALRGIPDLYAVHKRHGARWIEVKDPKRTGKRSLFTSAQLETFPHWSAAHIQIYVLTGPEQEEYDKLFRPGNWARYLV